MGSRGRKSGAELTIINRGQVVAIPRLKPPTSLSDAERECWHRCVDNLPAGWFTGGEQIDLVHTYVRHTVRALELDDQLRGMEPTDQRFSKLVGAMTSRSALALSYARALRLTPSARTHPEVAGRRARHQGPASVELMRQRYAAEADQDEG